MTEGVDCVRTGRNLHSHCLFSVCERSLHFCHDFQTELSPNKVLSLPLFASFSLFRSQALILDTKTSQEPFETSKATQDRQAP